MQQNDAWKYINELVERMKKLNPYLIILFGSYAYGTPHKDSDIDILLVTNDNFIPKNYDELLKYRVNIRKNFRDIAQQIPLDIIIFSRPLYERFKALNSSFSREILSKGKVLYERNH